MNVRWLYSHRILVALLVSAAVAVGLMTVLVVRQQQDQANGQVYLEAGGSVGSNPFVPLISPPATVGENLGGGGTPVQAAAGTDNRGACDSEKLISYLTGDPQAGAAWVQALNSDRTLSWSDGSRIEVQQIPAYIHELTPRTITEDLSVTNYQFTNGAALAVQSVLEKGSVILVDSKEIARVRCASGNPLTPMVERKTPPIYRGKPWPSFQPKRVVISQHDPQCGSGEHYDGARCQQVAVCPRSEDRGNDGRCGDRGRPAAPDYGGRPDTQHWLDKPARPDEPQHPDEPGRPDVPQRPDEPARPDEPQGPDEPQRPGVAQRTGEPQRSGGSPHPGNPTSPDKPQRPDEPEQSDKASRSGKADLPDKPKDTGKPASSDKDEHPKQSTPSDKLRQQNKPAKPDNSAKSDKNSK